MRKVATKEDGIVIKEVLCAAIVVKVRVMEMKANKRRG
jgi:hypothetical protein